MRFSRDLNYGQAAERSLSEIISACGYNVTLTTDKGKFSDYDLIVNVPNSDVVITYEVKRDAQAFFTKNIAVEVSKRDGDETVPSGLSVSKADYFVYKMDGLKGYWAMPTDKLREMVQDKPIISGGDFNASNLVLLNRDEYKKHAFELTEYYNQSENNISNQN